MNRIDLPAFEALMAEVAECYDKRPYSATALKTWSRELEEHDYGLVQSYIRNWIRTKTKPPTIADISVPLADRLSTQIEARALSEKRAVFRLGAPATEFGRSCMETINEKLATRRAPGRWWAYELRDRARAGGQLGYAQERLARRACGPDWFTDVPFAGRGQVERVPGSDDE